MVLSCTCHGVLPNELESTDSFHERCRWSSRLNELVDGLSPRRLRFASWSVHVGFMVGREALGQVFLGFPCQYRSVVALLADIIRGRTTHAGGRSSESLPPSTWPTTPTAAGEPFGNLHRSPVN
jgi:hypothetical protein